MTRTHARAMAPLLTAASLGLGPSAHADGLGRQGYELVGTVMLGVMLITLGIIVFVISLVVRRVLRRRRPPDAPRE